MRVRRIKFRSVASIKPGDVKSNGYFLKETLIKSLSDFTLEVLYMARNQYFFKTSAPSYNDAPYHHSSFLIIKRAALQKECGSLHIAIKKASQKDAALVHSSRSVTIQAIIVVRRQGFFGYSSQGYCSALSLRPKEYSIRTGLSRKFMRGI